MCSLQTRRLAQLWRRWPAQSQSLKSKVTLARGPNLTAVSSDLWRVIDLSKPQYPQVQSKTCSKRFLREWKELLRGQTLRIVAGSPRPSAISSYCCYYCLTISKMRSLHEAWKHPEIYSYNLTEHRTRILPLHIILLLCFWSPQRFKVARLSALLYSFIRISLPSYI